jgi:membrane protease YdiL (CAAX protease family)
MNVWVRFILGFATATACSWLSKFLPQSLQPVMNGALILAALLFIRLSKGRLADFGFVRPKNMRWIRVILPGILLGAVAALIALVFSLDGMKDMMKNWSFLEIVLFIWIWSSLSEEIFCRGWFQSGLPRGANRCLWSATLFGSMHLSLLLTGVPMPTVLLIVCSTFALGWLCAVVRDQYDSWIPAFVCHFGFNSGAMLGGIIYAIGIKVITGHLPPQ